MKILWHGSSEEISDFTKKPALHLGTLSQAAMRASGKLHMFEVDTQSLNLGRVRDRGFDKARRIADAKRKGKDALIYLNRFEGIVDTETLAAAEADANDLPDSLFRKACPSARDSLMMLDVDQVKLLGVFSGKREAQLGLLQHTSMRMEKDPKWQDVAKKTFTQWVGRAASHVMDEEMIKRIGFDHLIEDARYIIHHFQGRLFEQLGANYEQEDWRTLDCKDGALYVMRQRKMLVLDAETGDPLGGAAQGLPFVEPEHRGRGIGKHIQILNTQYDLQLFQPISFSQSGLGARLSAHKALCQEAYDLGFEVCEENIADYQLDRTEPAFAP